MPDVSIVNSTVTGTPKNYTVPGTQELLVKAVRASIDGTAAASAFLPALQLLDPAGHVMWTAVDVNNTVAAGGTADVSWFPGVSPTAATGSTTSAWKFATLSANAIVTVNAGTSKIVDMAPVGLYTNDSTTFAIGTQLIGGFTYHGISCLKDGHYLAKGQAQVIGFAAAAAGDITALWQSQPGGPASYGSQGAVLNTPVAVTLGQWDPYIEGLTTVSGGSTNIWVMQVANNTAVNVTAYIDMIAVQLDTDTTHIF